MTKIQATTFQRLPFNIFFYIIRAKQNNTFNCEKAKSVKFSHGTGNLSESFVGKATVSNGGVIHP
jgi:hypothetical protein